MFISKFSDTFVELATSKAFKPVSWETIQTAAFIYRLEFTAYFQLIFSFDVGETGKSNSVR